MTPAQAAAVTARGNVLLEAGAGAGKTSTLVARCLAQVMAEEAPASLDEILMVTFTEAAAAEMRRRIREALNARAAGEPASPRLAEQLAMLDQARIGTLHSFCFRLVREHFHELGLDPQSQVLDEGEARLLALETAAEVLDRHFAADPDTSAPVLELIQQHGEGDAAAIEALLIRLHRLLQTLPDPEGWLTHEEQAWRRFDRAAWEHALRKEFHSAAAIWLEQLAAQPVDNVIAHQCAATLRDLCEPVTRLEIARVTAAIAAFRNDEHWHRNKGRHRDPIVGVLDEAATIASFAALEERGGDPLETDFNRMQPHVLALIGLVREFAREFASRKRQRAALDFSDLEQCSLRLLWDTAANAPTQTARQWRAILKAVLVDEYQDINEAQDRIIAALSRDADAANRFLVGDVKQSIYGFRLARPDIFLRYARRWRADGADGQVLPLSDNFRSHEAVLGFVNRCFAAVLREDVGGIGYPDEAHLRFGDPAGRTQLARAHDPGPRVEINLRLVSSRRASSELEETGDGGAAEELTNAEHEAVITANRLRRLRATGFQVFDRDRKALRPVRWGDMAILLRATAGKAEVFAQIFARAGIPLSAEQKGFFESLEVSDLVSLFMLLDNPRQDLPLLAVLRSPLVGLTPEELVAVRQSAPGERSFWMALNRHQELTAHAPDRTPCKVRRFLENVTRWRGQVRRGSLSQCLEDILDATHYLTWLQTQPRGQQRAGNVQRLLELTRRYDSWQGRGLHRFLKYVRLLDEDGEGPETAVESRADAVRLMTIHASKGLEFPVVVLAGLNRPFRRDAPVSGCFIDEELGICPEVFQAERNQHYPSLRMLSARRKREQQMIAEEIRLLYVAMTRACDRLILVGTAAESRVREQWSRPRKGALSRLQLIQARAPLDLIGPLLPDLCMCEDWYSREQGAADLIAWRILAGDQRIELERAAELEPPLAAGGLTESGWIEVVSRLARPYPFLESTRRTGKTTVTRIRKQISIREDAEAGELFRAAHSPPSRSRAATLSAAEAGIAHHSFFQKFSFAAAQSVDQLGREADRLLAAGALTQDERAALQIDRVFSFWATPVGRAILDRRTDVQRELEFTCAFPAGELEALAGRTSAASDADDPVVVQGIVDLAVIGPRDIWLLDYKTDAVSSAEVAGRARRYQPQLELYRRALERTYARPVTRAWLHFLGPGVTVALDGTVV